MSSGSDRIHFSVHDGLNNASIILHDVDSTVGIKNEYQSESNHISVIMTEKKDIVNVGIHSVDNSIALNYKDIGGVIAATGGSGGGRTYQAGTGLKLNGSTFNHKNSVEAGTAGSSTDTTGSSIDIPYITYDSEGHITGSGTRTHTVSDVPSTSILQNTTSYWNSQNSMVAAANTIYVYTDYLPGGIPGVKIGDGTSYLIDMPFIAGNNTNIYNYASLLSGTTDYWEAFPTLVGAAGTIYVYVDAITIDNGDNTYTYIPKIKVGDGSTYLTDIPFVGGSGDGSDIDSETLLNHISNTNIHVTVADKEAWDRKWRGYMSALNAENLVFTTAR